MIRGSRGRVGGRREFIDQRLFQQGQVFVLLHTAELRFHVPERRRTPAQRLIACAPSPRRAPRAPRARPPPRGRRAPAPRGETRRTCARASVAVCTTPRIRFSPVAHPCHCHHVRLQRLQRLLAAVAAAVFMIPTARAEMSRHAPPVRSTTPECAPDNGGIMLPKGFCAVVVADNLAQPRHLVVTPNGDLFVSSMRAGIIALRDTTGDGKTVGRCAQSNGERQGDGQLRDLCRWLPSRRSGCGPRTAPADRTRRETGRVAVRGG